MNTFNLRTASSRNRSRSFLQEFIREYNRNMRMHSETMLEYNRNVTNIISILQNTQDIPQAPASTPSRMSNRSDIARLIYLLNQTTEEEQDTGLTREQFIDATESVTYVSGNFNETQCPISLDEFSENELVCQIRHCRHIFRHSNLSRWFGTHFECPVCRHDLRETTIENDNIRISNILSNLLNLDASGNTTYTFELPIRFD